MNLIIGNTSQLSNFFPEECDRISSRNIDYSEIITKKYDKIFLLFAEQRTYLNEDESFFIDINFDYTISVINKLKNFCNKIIVFSTSELWNDYDGEVSIDMPYKYGYSPYIKSKEVLSNYINENRKNYENVIIIYPFNFNSPYRNRNFLFGKIFDSIMNLKKITIGDVNFERDLIHPSIIVKNSLNTNSDMLIGSGELINIENFIREIYTIYNLEFNDYISFDIKNSLPNIRKNYYSKVKYSNYNELLNLTCNDIQKHIFSKRYN